MGWFRKSQKEQSQKEPSFKAVYYTAEAVRRMPILSDSAPLRAIEELASSGDESALQKAISELGTDEERAAAQFLLGLPPITSAKVATLSLEMHASVGGYLSGVFASTVNMALWQLLMSDATPDQLALFEQIASPTSTSANYDVAYEQLSALMTSALRRNLKVGERETVRNLISNNLRLIPSPEQLLVA